MFYARHVSSAASAQLGKLRKNVQSCSICCNVSYSPNLLPHNPFSCFLKTLNIRQPQLIVFNAPVRVTLVEGAPCKVDYMCQISHEKIWQSFLVSRFWKTLTLAGRIQAPLPNCRLRCLQQFWVYHTCQIVRPTPAAVAPQKNVPTTTWELRAASLPLCGCVRVCVGDTLCLYVCARVCECQARCHLWFMQRVQCKKSTSRRHKAHNLCRSRLWCLLCGWQTSTPHPDGWSRRPKA